MENRAPRRNFLAAAIWFGTSALIALVMLLTATVIWLSELTGSFIASILIVGGFFALLALLIYLLRIRDAIEEIRTEMETVYDVARTAKAGYEWVTGKIALFLQLRETLRDK